MARTRSRNYQTARGLGKIDLVREVGECWGLPIRQYLRWYRGNEAVRTVDTIFRVIAAALKRGERVTIPGFGSFFQYHRKPYRHYSPYHRGMITIPAKTFVKFQPCKEIHAANVERPASEDTD